MIATNNGGFPWRDTANGRSLEEGRASHERGQLPLEDLRGLEDRVTRQIIDAQVEAGLDLITDGLLRHIDPVQHLIGGLTGVTVGEAADRFPGTGEPFVRPVVEGEIAWEAPFLVEDFLFATQAVNLPTKPVLTGPYTLARVSDDRTYDDPMSLAMAFATALNQELRALQKAGATFIQVEEPAILFHREEFPIFTRIWEVLGRGISATLCLRIQGGDLGDLFTGICRLKRLGCLSVDCTAGRGNLDLLRSSPLPEGLSLGLGVIDGSTQVVDSPEAIVAMLESAGGLPHHERILLGTASDLRALPSATAAAKLLALARAARLLESR